jgi:hypothetical protein
MCGYLDNSCFRECMLISTLMPRRNCFVDGRELWNPFAPALCSYSFVGGKYFCIS